MGLKVLFLHRNPQFHRTQFGVESDTCEKLYCSVYNEAMSIVKRHKPDCIFVNKQFHRDTIKLITEYGCPMIYFYGDYREPILEETHIFMRMAKAVFLTWHRKDIYKTYNAHLTRQGVDAQLWKPLDNVEEEFDVVFTGGHYKRDVRTNIMSALNRDFNLLVVGQGWGGTEFKNWEKKCPPANSNYHLNRGKVNIGTFSIQDISYLTYYTSNRLYQGMASGKPHIGPRTPRLEEFFRDEDGYQDYASYEELKYKINTFLNNPNLRKLTGAAQREAILRENTVWHAWKRMEKIIINELA